MRYRLSCSCGASWCVDVRASEYESLKSEGRACSSCGDGLGYPAFNVNGSQFMMKGDAWADKNYRFKDQMTASNRRAKVRQEQAGHFKPTLQPNYKGKLTEDWREAAALRSKDKGDDK